MKGHFAGVVTGTFETSSGVPVTLLAVCMGIVALVSWLLTVLVELAVTAGALLVLAVGACVLLRRHSDRDKQLLAERFEAMHAEVDAPHRAAVTAPAVVHYHIHLAPGTSAGDAIAALPHQRDAIT